MTETGELRLIDVSPLLAAPKDESRPDVETVAGEIDLACRHDGFFRIIGHGIDPRLFDVMSASARDFFGRPEDEKADVTMAKAGAAWRGWFPVGGELTSGRPDRKEGLYVGLDHGPDHPRVREGAPLHGPNLFPADPPELGPAIRSWLEAVTPVAHAVMRGIALGLGLRSTWFEDHLTADPTILFRVFHYPPVDPADPSQWGVAEHTDYGLLTLLAQDDRGGLQVDGGHEWIDVPADPGVLVCNIGDMLDRLTEGRYRSTPHRVMNMSGRSRLSFPFFFDPSWDAVVTPLPLESPLESPLDGSNPAGAAADAARRWDGTSVKLWDGTYGEYLSAKVAKVFPELFASLD
jgi:isopenicillin N synthase-like dioxygenase